MEVEEEVEEAPPAVDSECTASMFHSVGQIGNAISRNDVLSCADFAWFFPLSPPLSLTTQCLAVATEMVETTKNKMCFYIIESCIPHKINMKNDEFDPQPRLVR